MLRVTRTQPQRPGEFVAVPSDVDALRALTLAKDPAYRPASAAALAAAWKAARRDALDPALRTAAAQLLAVHPWGAEVDPENKTVQVRRKGSTGAI